MVPCLFLFRALNCFFTLHISGVQETNQGVYRKLDSDLFHLSKSSER